jgi:2-iminobutanoate/2-iminopropanoate deaminase
MMGISMQSTENSEVGEEDFMPPIAPYLRAGNTIYLAGQIAMDEHRQALAPGDLVRQTEIIFDQIAGILAEEKATLDHVVKLVTYFTVPLDFEVAKRYWGVRRQYFGDRNIASTGVQVVSLIHPLCLVEIEAIAVVE